MSRTHPAPVRRLALACVAAVALLVPAVTAGPVLADGPTPGRTSRDARLGTLKVTVASLPGERRVVVRAGRSASSAC